MIKLLASTCLAIGLLAVAQAGSAAVTAQPAVSSSSITTPAAKQPVTTLAQKTKCKKNASGKCVKKAKK